MTIFAYTAPGCDYPGYVSFNRTAEGDVSVTVREAPTEVDGSRVCGVTCRPGGEHCNNYCNMAPEKGPMQDHPQRHKFWREGKSSTFVVPASEWSLEIDPCLEIDP